MQLDFDSESCRKDYGSNNDEENSSNEMWEIYCHLSSEESLKRWGIHNDKLRFTSEVGFVKNPRRCQVDRVNAAIPPLTRGLTCSSWRSSSFQISFYSPTHCPMFIVRFVSGDIISTPELHKLPSFKLNKHVPPITFKLSPKSRT